MPANYKELDGWKPATPKEAASGEPWWSIYSDPVLDGLEHQIDISNQTLKANEAAYREAQAIVAEARAGFFPSFDLNGSAIRSGNGGGGSSSSRSSSSSVSRGGGGVAQNSFGVSAQASWAPDIWGSVRRTVESDVANAQASAADLAAARLSAQATLAADYFQLRVEDELAQLLSDEVDAFSRSLQITQNRYNVGTAAKTDVMSATAQLENARAQRVATGVLRAQFEHAIAVLIGKPPAEFALAPAKLPQAIPVTPPALPSELLERNPTIAASERAMAAANAKIGVAIAGYFPNITLGGSYGQQSSFLHTLLTAANSVWSFGLTNVTLPIFNGGLTSAQVAASRAAYDQTVAQYRQAVLVGFQQVEDELSASRILEQQADGPGACGRGGARGGAAGAQSISRRHGRFHDRDHGASDGALERGDRGQSASDAACRQRQSGRGAGRRMECPAVAERRSGRIRRDAVLAAIAAATREKRIAAHRLSGQQRGCAGIRPRT